MKRTSRWAGALLILGTAAFAFGTFELLSSAVGSLTGTIIIAIELAISLAVYLLIRQIWPAAFGPPWKSD